MPFDGQSLTLTVLHECRDQLHGGRVNTLEAGDFECHGTRLREQTAKTFLERRGFRDRAIPRQGKSAVRGGWRPRVLRDSGSALSPDSAWRRRSGGLAPRLTLALGLPIARSLPMAGGLPGVGDRLRGGFPALFHLCGGCRRKCGNAVLSARKPRCLSLFRRKRTQFHQPPGTRAHAVFSLASALRGACSRHTSSASCCERPQLEISSSRVAPPRARRTAIS